MKLQLLCGLVTLALAAASGAVGAPAPSDRGTQVGEVVVPGGPPPKVSESYPADGSAVPAGTLVLKIVFDQPMTADGWSYGRLEGVAFPKCLQRPRLLGDHRTFVLLCMVAAHENYAIQINAPREFVGEGGRKAKLTLLHFSTGDVGPRDIHDALLLAGLTDVDDPVMTWRDSGAGVSQSSPPPEDSGSGAHP